VWGVEDVPNPVLASDLLEEAGRYSDSIFVQGMTTPDILGGSPSLFKNLTAEPD
jgi:hypothetical protein